MFDGFEAHKITLPNGIEIFARTAGSGPPLLLLHGYPQNHLIWRHIAPKFVEMGLSVVCADLRGYGDSSKPDSDDTHMTYSKRSMAQDMVLLMEALGHSNFYLVGHDRGGRVAHRLAVDYPEKVLKVVFLDIAPTDVMYREAEVDFATGYYHWFFLIQPKPLPEKLLMTDPTFYLRHKLNAWNKSGDKIFNEAIIKEYARTFCTLESIAATCEDYRAAATVDLDHNQEDILLGRKIICPILCLWGAQGLVGRLYDVIDTWQEKGDNVRGFPVAGGHFCPEEAPDECFDHIWKFIGDC